VVSADCLPLVFQPKEVMDVFGHLLVPSGEFKRSLDTIGVSRRERKDNIFLFLLSPQFISTPLEERLAVCLFYCVELSPVIWKNIKNITKADLCFLTDLSFLLFF